MNDQNAVNTSSNVINLLSKYIPGKAGVAFGGVASVLGVVGGILGSLASEDASKATREYRNKVISELNSIKNGIEDIKKELGFIEQELQSIYQAILAKSGINIAEKLAIIDTTLENFTALHPPDKNNLDELQKCAEGVFKPKDSVIWVMNTLHEFLTEQVFSPTSQLEGKLSIAGYMYLKSKLILGLNLMGYATNFEKSHRDFGVYLKDWSQHFADQMHTVIEYGKRNPTKFDPYTAHFSACWGDCHVTKDGFSGIEFYCRDNICFSPILTSTMPYKMDLVQMPGDQYLKVVFDGSKYEFQNRYNFNYKEQASIGTIECFSSWAPEQDHELKVKNDLGQEDKLVLYISDVQEGGGDGPWYENDLFKSPWKNVYSIQAFLNSGRQHFNKYVFLSPQYSIDGGFPHYLGSVDGMLNVIEKAPNGGQSHMTACLFEYAEGRHDHPNKLITLEANDNHIVLKEIDELYTFQDALVNIVVVESNDKLPYVTIQFTYSKKYLSIDSGEWTVSLSPITFMIAYEGLSGEKYVQPITNPYDMRPVPIILAANESYKFTVVHQSPFSRTGWN